MHLVILYHSQVTRTAPEPALPHPNFHLIPTLSLDGFNIHLSLYTVFGEMLFLEEPSLVFWKLGGKTYCYVDLDSRILCKTITKKINSSLRAMRIYYRKSNPLNAGFSSNIYREELEHPPYSPDISPCDFDLVPKINKPIRGRRFATQEDIANAVREQVTRFTHGAENDEADGIQRLPHRWQGVVTVAVDYIGSL
ncbi:uncharacterized protein TNCV_1029821 [Trichonephila clavipes]|nr:uncharacterized protein TNCV_1029821 [Trichonephila clavipes]